MQGEPSDEEVNVLMNSLDNSHVIMDTTAEQVYTLNETGRPHVAFIDMGAKQGIIRDLLKRGCKLQYFLPTFPLRLSKKQIRTLYSFQTVPAIRLTLRVQLILLSN